MSYLRGMTALESLTINSRLIGDIGLEKLKGLNALRTLIANCPDVTDAGIKHLQPLSRFTTLTLKYTGITDETLALLKGSANLRTLNIPGTKVTDEGLSSLRGMTALETLDIEGVSVNDAGLERLQGLTGLRAFSASGGKITDAGVKHLQPLSRFTFLRLNNTTITDETLCCGRQFQSRELNIPGTKVTPAGVAALHEALPNCRIMWPGEGQYDGQLLSLATLAKPITTFKEPAFQQWMKDVQALPAEKQIEAVSKKLIELNPRFDGKVKTEIGNGAVTRMEFVTDNVTNISPVRALMGLTSLGCQGSSAGKGKLSDLSPIEGMPLTLSFGCSLTQVSNLSPLRGMKLKYLAFGNSPVSDLSPLQGMPLTHLECYGTKVSDLSPLQGMPLTNLNCARMQAADLSPLEDCKGLTTVNLVSAKVTPAQVAALQKALPNCKIVWPGEGQFYEPPKPITTFKDPAFQQWMKDVQALPAEKQVEAVSKKLMELNPGFDGKLGGIDAKGMPRIEKGVVTLLGFYVDNVNDISPVRALAGLKRLDCDGSGSDQGKLSDLSPLQGMA